MGTRRPVAKLLAAVTTSPAERTTKGMRSTAGPWVGESVCERECVCGEDRGGSGQAP